MSRKKATVEKLGVLHGLVADTIVDEIEGYKTRKEPVPPAVLAQAIKFLSENGIQADPAADPKIEELRQKTSKVLAFPFEPAKTG